MAELCATCGCPRVVHRNDAECLHCLAFEHRKEFKCKEFIPQKEHLELVIVNPVIVQELCFAMFAAGICIGVGMFGIGMKQAFWMSIPLLAIGIFLGALVMRIIPRRGEL